MQPAPFNFAPPGRSLCRYQLDPETLASFGAPHYAPDGPRSLPAWGFVLECGLIVEIQYDEQAQEGLLHAELRELEHAIRHLGVSKQISWRMDEDQVSFERALEEYHPVSWGRWTVARHTPSGDIEVVTRCLSPGDARCHAASLCDDGATAFVQEEPPSRARARRDALTQARRAKRNSTGVRWEVWWVDDSGARSLVQLLASEQQAKAWHASAAARSGGHWEVCSRGSDPKATA
jgi:hypothetical protein